MSIRAFITGGTGFVGANLVAELNQRGIAARVLHRQSSSLKALAGLTYESVIGDILAEPAVLAEGMADCAWVFHVAAVADYWRQGQDWLYKVNVEGTRRVLQAAQLAGVGRLVFTSSLAAMGVPAFGECLDEMSVFNLRPDQFPYGHSKYLAEQEVQKSVANGLEAVIVNPSVVLGPRDVNMISGAIVVEAARGLLRFSAPGGVNYVDVQDVVVGQIEAAVSGRVGHRYILGGHNITHQQGTHIVCQIVGQKPPPIHLPQWSLPLLGGGVRLARLLLGNRIPLDHTQVKMLGETVYADITKAQQELNLPQTPFRHTVQRTYNWYNENGYLPRPKK